MRPNKTYFAIAAGEVQHHGQGTGQNVKFLELPEPGEVYRLAQNKARKTDGADVYIERLAQHARGVWQIHGRTIAPHRQAQAVTLTPQDFEGALLMNPPDPFTRNPKP